MSEERKLRFRIKRGEYEVELEGEFDYVKDKFEELLAAPERNVVGKLPQPIEVTTVSKQADRPRPSLEGIIERTSDGRPHIAVPVDLLSAKEAIGILLYAEGERMLDHSELSSLLTATWKTTGGSVVRARASDLRREGKLVAEHGSYRLSGAGLQWLESEVLPRVRRMTSQSTQATIEVVS